MLNTNVVKKTDLTERISNLQTPVFFIHGADDQALIDRLIHHGEVYYPEGDSYRMKGKQDLLVKNEESSETEEVREGKELG
ncbi:MAG: hypothetical protein V5A77_04400 [Candidatus Bipolaricaulota bacterium]